jgi:hypothetical protein
LSIGYAACHWCHVMAHESFEDAATAEAMNSDFVCIKVDREERPDVDAVYMEATQAMTGQGGWPMTVFATPEGEPFFCGTYFPPRPRPGMPSFPQLLGAVAEAWRERRDELLAVGQQVVSQLDTSDRVPSGPTLDAAALETATRELTTAYDEENGGFGSAPKFPPSMVLEFLLRHAARTGDDGALRMVEGTAAAMARGGMYDQLAGGFARYSVDADWVVPHFEKMLYDNAQLLELLALAFQRSGNLLFAQRARETVAWLTREMTTDEGAFAASLDADSEGEEGKFYVWSKNEIIELIGPEAGEFFARHYDVTDEGNFEGHNILNRLNTLPRTEADEARLSSLRTILLDGRAGRVRPGLDDKVLADWNGLMIAALVNASVILDEPDWLTMARRAFNFIEHNMTRGDRLGHSWRDGKLLFPGLASDFAAMIRAALAIHEAIGERTYLERALVWQNAFDAHYVDADTGGYYLSSDDASDLLLRPHSTQDDATPNPNAVAAQNLVRLAVLTGDEKWREKADRLIEGILSAVERNLFGHVALLNALDLRLRGAELVATGRNAEPFAQAALKLPFVERIVLRAASTADLSASHPAQEKLKATPGSALFVCVGERCSLPVTEASNIAAAVGAMRSS